jgi:hypothetical protein
MGGTLLMAYQNMGDAAPFFGAIQFIIDWQNCAAGVPKDMTDTMTLQTINEGIGSSCTHGKNLSKNTIKNEKEHCGVVLEDGLTIDQNGLDH